MKIVSIGGGPGGLYFAILMKKAYPEAEILEPEDGAYAHFASCYDGLFAETPFFPTAGNHDMGNGAIWDYKEYLEAQKLAKNPAMILDPQPDP